MGSIEAKGGPSYVKHAINESQDTLVSNPSVPSFV